MTEEVEYEALPSNAGLAVRLSFFLCEEHLTHKWHHKVNMLAGAMVSHVHGQSCRFVHDGYDRPRGSNNAGC